MNKTEMVKQSFRDPVQTTSTLQNVVTLLKPTKKLLKSSKKMFF